MELNKFIDHTILKPDSTKRDVEIICEQANEFKFAAVCVAPCWGLLAKKILDEDVKLCIVKNFPHGNLNDVDSAPTFQADEIDFVNNIGYVKSGMWKEFENDLFYMRQGQSGAGVGKIIKVIVEVGYLTDEELFRIADLLIKHKVDFIKTCTGYGPRNVTLEDIVKIKKHVGNAIKIKASGGIKTAEFATQLIEAGADRIGTSSSVSIMNETR